jgi:hypothetical protein
MLLWYDAPYSIAQYRFLLVNDFLLFLFKWKMNCFVDRKLMQIAASSVAVQAAWLANIGHPSAPNQSSSLLPSQLSKITEFSTFPYGGYYIHL